MQDILKSNFFNSYKFAEQKPDESSSFHLVPNSKCVEGNWTEKVISDI